MPLTIGNRGERLDLEMRQGSSLGPIPIEFENPDGSPVDLSEMTFRAQMRKTYDSPLPALTFVCEKDLAQTNKVNLFASAEQSAALTVGSLDSPDQSVFVWDMEAEESGSRVLPIFYGYVRVYREITRAL